eukprot:SAG31_NODE_25559_length_459_cov_0.708333_1_plen_32_part_01
MQVAISKFVVLNQLVCKHMDMHPYTKLSNFRS